MKYIASFAVALLLSPAVVAAQEAPAEAPPGPPSASQAADPQAQQRFAAMRQIHEQMRQMHVQMRTQMLSALTPAHRQLVASVIGNLAISGTPNPVAAAQQLDLRLSPAEKQSVVNLDTAMRNAMHNAMQAAHAQFEGSLTAEQRAKFEQRAAQMRQNRPAIVQDPGRILLRTLGSHEMHEGRPGPPGPPGPA